MLTRFLHLLDASGTALALHFSGVWRLYVALAIALGIIAAATGSLLLRAPAGFPVGLVTVEEGQSLGGIAAELSAARVIAHPLAFEAIVRLSGHGRDLGSGTYLFEKPAGVLEVAWRLAHHDTGIEPVRVTFPEGTATFDMARILARALPGFDAAAFQALAAPDEGYLFPDTYLLLPGMRPEQVITRLHDAFAARTKDLAPDIAASGHSLHDIVTMASIAEREAATPEDRRIVAGILWHRLRIGMALQVDAPFAYLKQDAGYRPKSSDLDSDSPYNTYRNKGLPPGPIANPGLDALVAALHPTETPYLYYLTGRDGNMYYAKTFDEHKQNRAKYLD